MRIMASGSLAARRPEQAQPSTREAKSYRSCNERNWRLMSMTRARMKLTYIVGGSCVYGNTRAPAEA